MQSGAKQVYGIGRDALVEENLIENLSCKNHIR